MWWQNGWLRTNDSLGPPIHPLSCGLGRQNLNDGITALETDLSKQEQDRTVAAEELRRRETVIIDLITYAVRDPGAMIVI